MSTDKCDLLISTILSQPRLVPSDYAIKINTSTRAVNAILLHEPAGQRLVEQGMISVVENETPPAWAIDPLTGQKRAAVGYATRTEVKPKALIVVPPPPPASGVDQYDKMARRVHELDCELSQARSAKQKNEILDKRAEAIENQAIMMSFMRDRERANREAISANQQLIEVLRGTAPVGPVRTNGHDRDFARK